MKQPLSIHIIAALASTLIFTGCANSSNTQKGAGIGAAVGALIGKGTGDNDKSRYVWGAAIGALAGSAIGNYMDKQEAALKSELADTGVQVIRDGEQLRLIIPGELTFASDGTQVQSNFYPVLNDVAVVLSEFEKTKLSIEGHTDSTGSDMYNQDLSMARANSVAAYLSQQNISPDRLQTLGLGESQPIASNASEESRQKNRRVELNIIPVSNS